MPSPERDRSVKCIGVRTTGGGQYHVAKNENEGRWEKIGDDYGTGHVTERIAVLFSSLFFLGGANRRHRSRDILIGNVHTHARHSHRRFSPTENTVHTRGPRPSEAKGLEPPQKLFKHVRMRRFGTIFIIINYFVRSALSESFRST